MTMSARLGDKYTTVEMVSGMPDLQGPISNDQCLPDPVQLPSTPSLQSHCIIIELIGTTSTAANPTNGVSKLINNTR